MGPAAREAAGCGARARRHHGPVSIPISDGTTPYPSGTPGVPCGDSVGDVWREVSTQVWFTATELLPVLVARAYSDVPLDDGERRDLDHRLTVLAAAAHTCAAGSPAPADEPAQQDELGRFAELLNDLLSAMSDLNVHHHLGLDSEAWDAMSLVGYLGRLHNELRHARQAPSDAARARGKLATFHLFVSENLDMLSSTELGLVAGLLVRGMPLDEARTTVDVAVG